MTDATQLEGLLRELDGLVLFYSERHEPIADILKASAIALRAQLAREAELREALDKILRFSPMDGTGQRMQEIAHVACVAVDTPELICEGCGAVLERVGRRCRNCEHLKGESEPCTNCENGVSDYQERARAALRPETT